MPLEIDPDQLREISDQLLKTVTSPEFLTQLGAIGDTPADQRIQEVVSRMAPDRLRQNAIPLPEQMRISSRYFETGSDVDFIMSDTAAGEAIISAFGTASPGVLDQIRVQDPELFSDLATYSDLHQPGLIIAEPSICICVGAVVCVGVGGSP